ncbi:copper amine oxidase N-terminal domain-containing protein [Chakrabartyella piscis]|uniref:copper amine oxidase N-terminal domain-containing protein n=1 Tax=Chakrabartyella piscis TaxID=2918914 RepID=UPI002958D25E|nr:copper amine oxidase N-terminal domain-containing protein [Chakrabartyella piscis]
MKKIISLLIASAMVVSLVPATAFAGQDVSATAKVVGASTIAEGDSISDAPELQITIASASYSGSDAAYVNQASAADYTDGSGNIYSAPEMDFEVSLDGLDFDASTVSVRFAPDDTGSNGTAAVIDFNSATDVDEDELTFTVKGKVFADDQIIITLETKDEDELDAGDYVTVSVDSDAVEADDLVFITCSDIGMEASIKALTYIAEDEIDTLDKTLKIEESVSGSFASVASVDTGDDDADGNDIYSAAGYIVLEITRGFEFTGVDGSGSNVTVSQPSSYDDDELLVTGFTSLDTIEIDELEIVVDGASEGDIATIKATLYSGAGKKLATTSVEVVEVCAYSVVMSVDEDEDVPVMYAGVNSDNFGINDDSDHVSLEVTIEESFPGAWSYRDEFELTLPEGVYVVGVEAGSDNWDYYGTTTAIDEDAVFQAAYAEGGYESFVFEKRLFEETTGGSAIEITFELTLVADQDFEGEVVLGFVGDSVTESEVVIAEFVPVFAATAEQNDVIIDYRNTPINTPIVITEPEAELWNDDMEFKLSMEGDYMSFDSTGDITTNEDDSYMTVDVDSDSSAAYIEITVDDESEDEAGMITVENLELYMSRSLAAGAYGLDITLSSNTAMLEQLIYASGVDSDYIYVGDVSDDTDYTYGGTMSYEVQAAFVNIVTAGSDQDNAFITQVIVPIGESYIFAGGKQIDLDVPAYISEAGYTMLPVRAVSSALGIDTNAVQWNAEARQVTVIYSGKVIAMTIGESYMTVNGTAIATSAAPEITDSRTFLPLRDLATALSVSIAWDDATKTATLN